MSEDHPAPAVAEAPGFSTERMAMFTDAIFAIAMTLLVVEIKRPDEADLRTAATLGRFLLNEWSSFLAFLIAFFVLWAAWRRHNALTDQVAHWNRLTLSLHGPLLILVAFLPFATAVIGVEVDNPLALTLFAGAEALLGACEAAIKVTVYRAGLLKPDADRSLVRRNAGASIGVSAYFLLTAVLAWSVPHMAFAWLLAPLAARAGSRLAVGRRRPAPA